MDKSIQIRLYGEKIPDKGEDAEPVLWVNPDGSGLISVCDGLGGAGSVTYGDKEGGTHTAAYYASRLTNRIIEAYFRSVQNSPTSSNCQSLVDDLKAKLANALKAQVARIEKPPSKLRSTLIKQLPTTLAALYFWPQDPEARSYQCCTIWAGDSRGYLLNSSRGLQQLTEDDLKSAGDALENLINDSPLSNYINADVDFKLHQQVVPASLPCVLLVATDGCFGYVPTPMHFEYMLLNELVSARSPQEWQDRLGCALENCAGDDISLALVALGWPSFDALKHDFEPRLNGLARDYISPFERLDKKLARLTQTRERYARKREALRKEMWNRYKLTYRYREEAPVAGRGEVS